MAGRKQHFIPRHFLKEFVIPDGNDKIWMYRRGLPNPVPVSRDDAAATRDFYSKPAASGAPTLDDLITGYEHELRFLVEEARAVPAAKKLPVDLISEIVAHLTMRAAYLREFIDAGVSELASSIDTLIHQPSKFLENIELPTHRVPTKFEAVAMERLEQHLLGSLSNVTPKATVRLLYQAIRENFDQLQREASSELLTFLERFQGEFQGTARSVHVQVLAEDLVPAKQKARLEEFHWRVVHYPSGDAVLPDCVAIAEDPNGWGPYLTAEYKSMTRVVIPLSPLKLAVGSAAHDFEEVAEIYNQVACDSCFTFYLANRREDVPQTHLAKLGGTARQRIANVTSSALREAVKDFIGDAANDIGGAGQPVSWNDLATGSDFSFSVSFRDFGDETYAKRVGESLKDAVKAFGGYLPIHRLDGITFAADYAAALQELDRGQGTSRAVDPSAGTSANDVAMPLAVRRHDGIKTHIVLKGYIAEQLTSKDESLHGEAISVICYCLGTAAFNTLLEGKFPGTLLAPHTDPYEGWLYQYNDALLATYFSIRLLTPNKEMVEFYAEQALLKTDQMIYRIIDAHAQYQVDGEHERLFEICADHVSGFMMSMTRYFAARASLIGPQRPIGRFEQKLSQIGFAKWSKLFQADLAGFYDRLDDWASLDDMHFLNRHFERLLLEVGVLPDQLNDGSLYIHTSDEQNVVARLRYSKCL